jgi:hypothetical protein
MTIDPLNLSMMQIKSLGVAAFDKLNNVSTRISLDQLSFARASVDDKVLLQDVTSRVGVLMNKVSLGSLFPADLDIRPFKKGVMRRQKTITAAKAVKLNNLYGTDLVVSDPDLLDTPTAFDTDSVRDFVTFCRVFGFYNLKLSEVHLVTIEGKLIISVNSTHDHFTGSLEVWV